MRRLDRIRFKIAEAMSKDLVSALKTFAKEDMDSAKKDGSIGIFDTKKGAVHLSFADGKFSLHGPMGKVLKDGISPQEMEKYLINDIYDIDEQ